MGQYTLWCLNRLADWDRDRLARALAVKGLWSAKHDVALGSRARFDRHSVWEEDRGTGVLMHEDDACDEYFVPIAVKCIGDPDGFLARLGDRMSAEGLRRFEALRIDFARYFALLDDSSGGSGGDGGEPEWRRYWEPFAVNDALWDVGMFTRTDGATPYAGLYEIVASEARDHERRAILAGYSQGGLVARFLAWMDEQLMDADHRAIAGIVLVQSPNHGSPLADIANADNVSTGLLGILTGLGGLPIIGADDPFTRTAIERLATGRTDAVGDPIWHFGVGAICAVLDAAIKDTPASNPDRYDLLRTARKWMTGLSEEKTFTAFEDLDPAGLDDARTILGRLVTTPLASTFHGAIVGSDTALDDLFFEGRSCLERWLVRLLLAKRWFPPIETAYARIAMDEAAANVPQGERHKKIAALYASGLKDTAAGIDLPPFAHDFVIPSVSQALYTLTPPAAGNFFLGNKLNARGTHSSGADESDRDSDSPFVRKMLADLGERLP